jgi:predicted RNA-binding Zn-ribbon protein involved in translation (DUF1610 family)
MDDIQQIPVMTCSKCGWVGLITEMAPGKVREDVFQEGDYDFEMTVTQIGCPQCGNPHVDQAEG